jgi:hypothetical protein
MYLTLNRGTRVFSVLKKNIDFQRTTRKSLLVVKTHCFTPKINVKYIEKNNVHSWESWPVRPPLVCDRDDYVQSSPRMHERAEPKVAGNADAAQTRCIHRSLSLHPGP